MDESPSRFEYEEQETIPQEPWKGGGPFAAGQRPGVEPSHTTLTRATACLVTPLFWFCYSLISHPWTNVLHVWSAPSAPCWRDWGTAAMHTLTDHVLSPLTRGGTSCRALPRPGARAVCSLRGAASGDDQGCSPLSSQQEILMNEHEQYNFKWCVCVCVYPPGGGGDQQLRREPRADPRGEPRPGAQCQGALRLPGWWVTTGSGSLCR